MGDADVIKEGAGGFTLIETLVAMMVLVIALTMILQLFSGGLNSKARSEDYTRAVFHGVETMESILASSIGSDETRTGDFDDGYTWKATIYQRPGSIAEEDGDAAADQHRLFQVDVDISWESGGREKNYSLMTLTVAGPAAEAGN